MDDDRTSQTIELALIRRCFGFSQERVARILDCSARQIQRLESGTHVPDLPTAIGLALLYRTPLETLFVSHYRRVRERIGLAVDSDIAGSGLSPRGTLPSELRPRRVVGVDASNQVIGLAIIESGKILYSAVRYLSRSHPLAIRIGVAGLGHVESILRAFNAEVVVTCDERRRSHQAKAFCRHLKRRAAVRGIQYLHLTMSAVQRALHLEGRVNLHRLAEYVAGRCPDARLRVPPARRITQPQNPQMARFKAIALALAGDVAGDTSSRPEELRAA